MNLFSHFQNESFIILLNLVSFNIVGSYSLCPFTVPTTTEIKKKNKNEIRPDAFIVYYSFWKLRSHDALFVFLITSKNQLLQIWFRNRLRILQTIELKRI